MSSSNSPPPGASGLRWSGVALVLAGLVIVSAETNSLLLLPLGFAFVAVGAYVLLRRRNPAPGRSVTG